MQTDRMKTAWTFPRIVKQNVRLIAEIRGNTRDLNVRAGNDPPHFTQISSNNNFSDTINTTICTFHCPGIRSSVYEKSCVLRNTTSHRKMAVTRRGIRATLSRQRKNACTEKEGASKQGFTNLHMHPWPRQRATMCVLGLFSVSNF